MQLDGFLLTLQMISFLYGLDILINSYLQIYKIENGLLVKKFYFA